MPNYEELSSRLLGYECQDLGAGASEAEIAAAEKDLGLRIEGGYRQFLVQYGWGGVEHLELYGLGGPPHLDLVRITQSERSEMELALPKYLLPVMNDGGGNLFCLDTRTAGDPPVVFWDHTVGFDKDTVVDSEDFVSWLWSQLSDLES
ncbi:MAG: SMI1/KNR4 family protein [Planctomycetota bacterium]|nr:MAG: SMI1/KNR4 family protein [Planctomycetota bacterium]